METERDLQRMQGQRGDAVAGRRVFLPSNRYWYSAGLTFVFAVAWLILSAIHWGSSEGWENLGTGVLWALCCWCFCATATRTGRRAIVLDGEGIYMHQCGARLTGERGSERLSDPQSVLIPWTDIESIGIRRISLKDGSSYTSSNWWTPFKFSRRFHETTGTGYPFGSKVWAAIREEFEARRK